ncbi:MAG: MOSC domain-containing protein [Salinarimonadaceae bacterium]|nr:MAG: MOSC domain-containing protein [Salinarimonadaceae bacterium]
MSIRVEALHRYPVKGLSPEPLARATLTAGRYFPGDRVFAIENGPSGFDPAAPRHLPKIAYLMLMRDEALARLETRYEDAADEIVIRAAGVERLRAKAGSEDGKRALADFLASYLEREAPGALRGEPALLAAPEGYRFTDSARGYVSIVNLESVAALEDMVGAPVDPLRFRANIHVTGLPAWGEFDLVGRELRAPSGMTLRVTKRIVRCAATNVDPGTGLRDMAIPDTLMRRMGHMDCGVYAEIVAGGALSPGIRLIVENDVGARDLPFG